MTRIGLEYETDIRHVNILVEELQLDKANSVITPGGDSLEPGDTPCDDKHTARYKYLVAHADYLAFDRPDVQHAVKTKLRRIMAFFSVAD